MRLLEVILCMLCTFSQKVRKGGFSDYQKQMFNKHTLTGSEVVWWLRRLVCANQANLSEVPSERQLNPRTVHRECARVTNNHIQIFYVQIIVRLCFENSGKIFLSRDFKITIANNSLKLKKSPYMSQRNGANKCSNTQGSFAIMLKVWAKTCMRVAAV